MNFSLKAKCQGCEALSYNNGEWSCAFGLTLVVDKTTTPHSQPQPSHDKCYRPKTKAELAEAKVLMSKKLVTV